MTIVLDFGTWHVEAITNVLTIPDAAGRVESSTINVQRPGNLLSYTISLLGISDTVNAQVMANVEAKNQSGTSLAVGVFFTGIRIRANKQAGTGVTTLTTVTTLIIREQGRNP